MSNGESKPVCPPKARSMTDRERAEAIWNDRIGPTLQGFYTVNRGGIIGEIERALAAVRAEAHDAGGDCERERYSALERAVNDWAVAFETGADDRDAKLYRAHGEFCKVDPDWIEEALRSGDPQVQPTSADKDAVYVTLKGERTHFWRDEAEQVVRDLQAALSKPHAMFAKAAHNINTLRRESPSKHIEYIRQLEKDYASQAAELRTLRKVAEVAKDMAKLLADPGPWVLDYLNEEAWCQHCGASEDWGRRIKPRSEWEHRDGCEWVAVMRKSNEATEHKSNQESGSNGQ